MNVMNTTVQFPLTPCAMRHALCILLGILVIVLTLCLARVSLVDAAELSPVEGLARYKKLVRLHPQNATYHNALGYCHLRSEHLQAAEAELLKAIELDNSYAIAHNNLGIVYLNQGRPEQAEIQFRQAVRLRPYYCKAQYNLAVALFHQKLYAKAAAAYLKAKRMDDTYVKQRDNKEKIEQALDQVVHDNGGSKEFGLMK